MGRYTKAAVNEPNGVSMQSPQSGRRGRLYSWLNCWARGGAEQQFGGPSGGPTGAYELYVAVCYFFHLLFTSSTVFLVSPTAFTLVQMLLNFRAVFVMFPCLQSFGCLFAPSTRTSDSVQLEFIVRSRSSSALAMLENQHCAISLFKGAKSLFLTARSGVVCRL